MTPLLKVADVAKQLSVAPSTLYAWIAARQFPAVHLPNGTTRIDPDDLAAWLLLCKQKGPKLGPPLPPAPPVAPRAAATSSPTSRPPLALPPKKRPRSERVAELYNPPGPAPTGRRRVQRFVDLDALFPPSADDITATPSGRRQARRPESKSRG